MNISRTIDRNFRGGANAIKSGNYRRAVQRLRKSLDVMPGRDEFNWQRGAVHQLLAIAFHNLERHEEATGGSRAVGPVTTRTTPRPIWILAWLWTPPGKTKPRLRH